jgi:thiol-disulfide isomerase/thioredoxin
MCPSVNLMSLKWNDIKSITLDYKDYIKKFNHKNEVIKAYENFKPDTKVITEIKNLLKAKQIELKILVIGADWCPDCMIYAPQLVKIIECIDIKKINLKFIYGVKVDPFHKKGDLIWHKKKSPPEATNRKFNLEKIPTIYFFNTEGKLFGKIIESPEKFQKLEREMLYIFQNNL